MNNPSFKDSPCLDSNIYKEMIPSVQDNTSIIKAQIENLLKELNCEYLLPASLMEYNNIRNDNIATYSNGIYEGYMKFHLLDELKAGQDKLEADGSFVTKIEEDLYCHVVRIPLTAFEFVDLCLVTKNSSLVNELGFLLRSVFKSYLRRVFSDQSTVVALQAQIEKLNARLVCENQKYTERARELNAAKDQLLQSEKMASIGQLAAGVAHEINNPVGYISSNLVSLKSYIDDILIAVKKFGEINNLDAEKLDEIKSTIEGMDLDFLSEDISDLLVETTEGVDRVKKIVRDLKEFSHVGEAEWEYCDIHDGIESTLNIVNNELKYKAQINKNFSELPPVECVVSQLNQVFLNILVNAGHAIDKTGEINISTECNGEYVLVHISDSGCGIPNEHLDKIFEPFFTTKPVGTGTGLGMSLSYGIIKNHGGEITVDSEVEVGTTFSISLPVSQKDRKNREY